MVSDQAIDAIDAMLDLGTVGGLAGLSLVAYAFLQSRVQQVEHEAGAIKMKRGGADAYASALQGDARRMRLAARLVVSATVALLVSALLILMVFDTFLEADAGTHRGRALWDVVLTGIPFVYGLLALLVATVALGWDHLR